MAKRNSFSIACWRVNPVPAVRRSFTLIDTSTALYGVFGDPVAHSLGPAMHNQAFARAGLNAVYLAFRVRDLAGAMAGVRGLPMAGVSITIPHKVPVMEYLDEIDPEARAIGAVNTVVNRDGHLMGYNTDSRGALKALGEKIDPVGKTAAVIGAGGAARAIGYGLVKIGARVLIFNRTPEKGRTLARSLGAEFHGLADLAGLRPDIVINTTPVGMAPARDAMVVDPSGLAPAAVVMDIVYNPVETAFLKAARAAGCRVVDGLTMFVHQGAAQFELWTGRKASLNVMRRAALQGLELLGGRFHA